MIFNQAHPYLSPEEYLETEKASPIKHEYIPGRIYAMAGASDADVTITANLLTLLRNHIRGSVCQIQQLLVVWKPLKPENPQQCQRSLKRHFPQLPKSMQLRVRVSPL